MTERSNDIIRAAALLREGHLVALPTETVYGLAANAFDEDAVRQIFKAKNRPFYDPLILHTDDPSKIEEWGMEIPEPLQVLTNAFWPGPLTILLPKSDRISDLVTAGLPRVAMRVPRHNLSLSLLRSLDFPLAAPSANPFGAVSPTTADHVARYFDGRISMILDGGACGVGIESTIVGLEGQQIVVYRLGGLSIEAIERHVGKVVVRGSSSRPEAPGMLVRHYSPEKHVIAVDSQAELDSAVSPRTAVIFMNLQLPAQVKHSVQLSTTGDHEEAAAAFYAALHKWDDVPGVHDIVIERLPDFGLGRAINDRLNRAVVK